MSELTKRMSECDATDWAYRMREGIDRIEALEECLREVLDSAVNAAVHIAAANISGKWESAQMAAARQDAAMGKARALLEEK